MSNLDNKGLEQLRAHFPDVRPIRQPERYMLHLADQRWPGFTHCGQLTVDEMLDFEGSDLREYLLCKTCEKWGDALVERKQ